MAREESDREDLLREAVAFTRRMEMHSANQEEPVFLGFKRDGGLSIYLAADHVYQFNRAGQLRRAYRDGFLFRTQGTTLARLARDRSQADRVMLSRSDLTAAQVEVLLQEMTAALRELQHQLSTRAFASLQCVPQDADLIPEILTAMEVIFSADPQLAPAYKGRK